MIFIELRTVGTLHCSREYNMLPFCRELIKTVSRELNVGDNHQACATLRTLGKGLSTIRLQRRFKSVVILGGVEKTLIAMKKVISLLGKRHFQKVHSLMVGWCRMILR